MFAFTTGQCCAYTPWQYFDLLGGLRDIHGIVVASMLIISLVPGPFVEKEPGAHCLHMHQTIRKIFSKTFGKLI